MGVKTDRRCRHLGPFIHPLSSSPSVGHVLPYVKSECEKSHYIKHWDLLSLDNNSQSTSEYSHTLMQLTK